MQVRVASYNLENLFTRPAAMQEGSGQVGQQGEASLCSSGTAECGFSLRADVRYIDSCG